jgi:hypothetical protein
LPAEAAGSGAAVEGSGAAIAEAEERFGPWPKRVAEAKTSKKNVDFRINLVPCAMNG